MSYAQIRSLDAGFGWPYKGVDRPYRGKGIRVPALRDVLTAFPDHRFNIEIKQAEPPIAADLCALLRELGVGSKTLVASFHAEALQLFRRHCPEVASSTYRSEVGWFLVHQKLGLSRAYHTTAHAMQLPTSSYGINFVSPQLFDAARELGIHVDIWTINDEQEMRTLIRNKVGGIVTDRPDLLLDILKRRDIQVGTS
jgi:glycerophosphoryl diester phosphodiesterase